MLSLGGVETRIQFARNTLSEGAMGLSQAVEVAAQLDESEAYLDQLGDTGGLVPLQRGQVADHYRQIEGLRKEILLSVPKDSISWRPLRNHLEQIHFSGVLDVLHEEYLGHCKRLTKTYSRKSFEKYLRTELDADKRAAVYEEFMSSLRDRESHEVILKILKARGDGYAEKKIRTLSFQDVSGIESLILNFSRALGPQFKQLLAGRPSDFYRSLETRSEDKVQASFEEYKFRAFNLVEELFELRISRVAQGSLAENEEMYELRSFEGEVQGIWILDSYAREEKYKGAWVQTVLSRRELESGTIQVPLVYLNFDFTGNFISFRESRAFLHELGHALEHCLNQNVNYFESGINHLKQDALEISSLFMESFSTHPRLSGLFGEGLSAARETYRRDKIVDLATICLLSKIDLELHRNQFNSVNELDNLILRVRAELGIEHPIIGPGFLSIFDHAFADEDYASAYYSYLVGYFCAETLKEKRNSGSFDRFWRKSDSDYLEGLLNPDLDFERMLVELC